MGVDLTRSSAINPWRRQRAPLPQGWWMPAFDAAGMQPRKGQLMAFEMANELFANDSVSRLGLMAGVGTGKSYIAFALADAAIRSGYRKVIISTASISLAQQYEHDLVHQDDSLPHAYAVSSGLDNTLCRAALRMHNDDQGLPPDEVPVHIEARSTRFSQYPISKEDKHLSVRRASNELGYWPCYGNAKQGISPCEFLHDCVVYEQRDRAYDAQIVIANAIQVAWLLKRQAAFDSSDVFLIVDEADKAVDQLSLPMWEGKYEAVSLNDVLNVPSKVVFMSGTLTESIAERLGCQRYVVLPHLDRSNAPVLVDSDRNWDDRLRDFASAYRDKPGLVIVPNASMRNVVKEVLDEIELPWTLYDMQVDRAAVKAAHIAACARGEVPPVLLGFSAGAGIGLDLPGSLLEWLVVVGRPYGSSCTEDNSPVADEAGRSDNLIVQSVGRACRYDGDACRVLWLDGTARDSGRVIDRLEDEGVTVLYANTPEDVKRWLNGDPELPWMKAPAKIELPDEW